MGLDLPTFTAWTATNPALTDDNNAMKAQINTALAGFTAFEYPLRQSIRQWLAATSGASAWLKAA